MLFDWDDANILHLARHDVTPEEAEQVLKNEPVDVDVQFIAGEWRLLQAGETSAGRVLSILSAERAGKIRVITGWNAPRADRNIYLAHKVNQTWKPN